LKVHERQSSDERDIHEQFSDDEAESRGAFRQLPDFRRHAHCSPAETGNDVIERRVAETSAVPFQRLAPNLGSRDQPEPEVELTDCSSCSSVDTAGERHTVPTHCVDTMTRDDDEDDDEIINVVDDLVT